MDAVRFDDLFDWPDDEKLVTGLMEVARRHAKAPDLASTLRQGIHDLGMLNGAWYAVPNGGYMCLLQTRGDPIAPLRSACVRFGHLRAVEVLDTVRSAFPGGRVPRSYEAKRPFLEAADRSDPSVFYDESIVPVLAAWARRSRAELSVLDGPVDVIADPRELAQDADSQAAKEWLEAIGGYTLGSPTCAIEKIRLPQFRRDFDRVLKVVARWRGATAIESLDVSGTLPPYWCAIPFAAFPGLRKFNGQYSGMTDQDVDALLRLPHIKSCNVYYAQGLSPLSRERLLARFGDRCRL